MRLLKKLFRVKMLTKHYIQDALRDGSQGPAMVMIQSGKFKMGDRQGTGTKYEQPVHTVRIMKPFAIGIYPVTFEEYDRFAEATYRDKPNDKGWGRGRQPVINVDWEDAIAYIEWLSKQTGKCYRLPTEAEWEYAARAGTDTAYWWGNKMDPNMANCKNSKSVWSGKQTSPVGSFTPNAFGLYDTVGNVWEWVQDWYYSDYIGAPTDGSSRDEKDESIAHNRVIRGGSWSHGGNFARSSYRNGSYFVSKLHNELGLNSDHGFRVARDF